MFSVLSLCTVTHCLCWDPAIRTKLVLLVSSGGRKKIWDLIFCNQLTLFVAQAFPFVKSTYWKKHLLDSMSTVRKLSSRARNRTRGR